MISKTFSRGALITMLRVAPAISSSSHAGFLVELMCRSDVANGAALAAHDDRVGLAALRVEANALEEIAGGDAGRGEHHLAAGELFGGVDAVDVGDAHLLRAGDLFVAAGLEAPLHVAADAAHRGGGDDA